MRIYTNVSALNAWRNLTATDTQLSKVLERLSSGLRVNRAGDDAAGLAISEKMRAQIAGLNMAAKNALDGISLIQTAEGALNEVHAMLTRMEELGVQAANDTNTDDDRAKLNLEFLQLKSEIDRIGQETQFNTKVLFNFSGRFHIGPNTGDVLSVRIGTLNVGALGISAISVGTRSAANSALSRIHEAVDRVSSMRAYLGSIQNRLEHTINNLNVASENLSAAESRIRDADMAKEMTNFVRYQILLQSGTAMLAQANLKPQAVLQLLA